MSQYAVEQLNKSRHDRKSFSSGNRTLDEYLKRRARQDNDGVVATCYVAVETGTSGIAGYYTLSQYFIGRENLPSEILTKIASYENLPATLLGRLAVDVDHQGRQLGRALLFDALTRAARLADEISACCVVVDPIDQRAVRFYARNGFEHLAGDVKMFMTMEDIRASISSEEAS